MKARNRSGTSTGLNAVPPMIEKAEPIITINMEYWAARVNDVNIPSTNKIAARLIIPIPTHDPVS